MRTPDNETEGTETEGSEPLGAEASSSALADGFGGGDGDASETGDADNAFGSGWPSGGEGAGGGSDDEPFGSDDSLFLQQRDEAAGFDELEGSELSPFEFEPDYVPDTDTDWDITGDGVVDHHDLHEAATGLHDFHVDPADSHGHAQNEDFFGSE